MSTQDMLCHLQSLQNECDRIQNSLDDEVARRRRAESDLKLNVEQMTSLKVELEECKTDKQRLMTLNDSLEADKQVGDVITAATYDTRSSCHY